jgi:gluconolactonase
MRKTLPLLTAIWFGLHAARAVTFQIVDPVEFAKIIDTNAVHVTNTTLNFWLEGPVWVPSGGGYLVFSAMGTRNRLQKLVPPNTLTDFLLPPANTLFNGNTLDMQEQLVSCQGGSAGLRVVMTTNGIVSPLASSCAGLKFYSPNDVVVKSDGTIWFTDPGYDSGIGAPPQAGFQGGYYVYRFNPTNGNATCVPVITNNLNRPNGICFSPDETKLYVADSENPPHNIRVYTVSPSNTLSGGAVFATVTNGSPDGIRCDVDGRIWSSSGEGVYIFAAADGHLIGKIRFLGISNLCFGGPQYKTLYMTGQPVVTSIPVRVAGTPALKKLRGALSGGHLNLSGPAPSTGFTLQETAQLTPANWTNSPAIPVVSNGLNQVSLDPTNAAIFYRLRL